MSAHVNPYTLAGDPIMYWHHEGYSIEQIARKLRRDEADVRRYIVDMWKWQGGKRGHR